MQKLSDITAFQAALNNFGRDRIPCLFIVDYAMKNPLIVRLDEVDPHACLYYFRGKTNAFYSQRKKTLVELTKKPVQYQDYEKSFSIIQKELRNGNTYLVNLTAPTAIQCNETLREIFFAASAKYKLWYNGEFVFFSPEQFVFIRENMIRTFPMKGTIRASVPDAENIILADEKEMAEHITVVDLLRNDIGMVARKVAVDRFRYIEHVVTPEETLLQVSSEISGNLDVSWRENLGNLMAMLLPAGSVTGAPKKKTMEIIGEAEQYDRGYYTGVAGIFDGDSLDSCVMIRFIEKTAESKYVYKSGGGITVYSNCESEYRELVDKIYVPVA
ncbi:MAG: aminodeoxychorismate synthase component I [Spirochaetales bacterium]|nr:aminodeoxychorismate synthase component I [Spirochaetales bacterium]